MGSKFCPAGPETCTINVFPRRLTRLICGLKGALVYDSKMLPIMMEKIAKMGFKPKYVLADAGYDSTKNHRIIASYGAVELLTSLPKVVKPIIILRFFQIIFPEYFEEPSERISELTIGL
ncbi:MAG: hypothetical protein QXX41_14255 [Nitrososphaerota archaeon]